MSTTVPFLLAGLDNGEKCVLAGDGTSFEDLVKAIRKVRDISDDIIGRDLQYVSADEFYVAGGRFDPGRILGELTRSVNDALSEGYSGFRGVGEMSWSLKKPEGHEDLGYYESQINTLYPEFRGSLLCQYDDAMFESDSLLDMLWTHPRIIYKGTIGCNPYFVPPSQYSRSMGGAASRELFLRSVKEVARRTKLEELHMMELRNTRLMNRKASVLDDLATREMANMVSVTTVLSELALETCGDRDGRGYLEQAMASLESARRQLELMNASSLLGKTGVGWRRLDRAWQDAISEHASNRVNVAVDVGRTEVLAEDMLDVAFRGILQTLCDEVCGRIELAVSLTESDQGLVMAIEGACIAGSDRLEDKALRNCRVYGLVLAREILRASGITLVESGTPGRNFRLDIRVPPGRFR